MRGAVIACASVTLAACYGGVMDVDDCCSDMDYGEDVDTGTGGAGGATQCAAASEIDVEDPPSEVSLTLSATSHFDTGICSLDAGYGTGVVFVAPTSGAYEFTVSADFPVALSSYAFEGEQCDSPLSCRTSTGDGAGGGGGDAAAGGAGGAGGAGSEQAAVRVPLEAGESVALFVSGDPADTSDLEVTLHIESP